MILHSAAIRIFVKILGAGTRPKVRHRILHKLSDHRNLLMPQLVIIAPICNKDCPDL